jgi:hypothetical protein
LNNDTHVEEGTLKSGQLKSGAAPSQLNGDFLATTVVWPPTANENELYNTVYLKLRRIESDGPDVKHASEGSQWRWWEIALLLAAAWLFLLGLIGLQVVGLAVAAAHLREIGNGGPAPQKVWCSPGFQLANGYSTTTHLMFDGTCSRNHTVTFNSQGTGCISLPGDQDIWLHLTVVFIPLQLLLQMVDVYLLQKYWNSESPLRMRPLCTMAMGVVVWMAMTFIAGTQTLSYPLVSHVVAINSPPTADCQMFLDSAGLRGEIIAWSDGVFGAFKVAYFGPLGMD